MEIRNVQSSAIDAIGHDGSDLIVIYRGGRRYRYNGAGTLVNDLWNAEADGMSVGRMINAMVKPEYTYVEETN